MAKQAKQYGFGGRPGCVTLRRNRTTGHLYGLYQCEQAGLDGGLATPDTYDEDGTMHPGKPNPFATVCEDHGTICGHSSLKLAQGFMATGEWCEACMAEQQAAKGMPLHVALGDRDEFTCIAHVQGRSFSVMESGGWYWLYQDGFRSGRDQYRTPGDVCRAAGIDPDAAVWYRQAETAAE